VSTIILKNKRAIDRMRTAGKLLAGVFQRVPELLVAGMTTRDLDAQVEGFMRAVGLEPSCKGYGGYRHATCISVNDGVIHGVPSERIVLKDGDCVKLDIVGAYRGYCADMARTYSVGTASREALLMTDAAQRALDAGIALVRPGVRLGSVSACIQGIVESAGYGVVRAYAGHGIGKKIHEEPEVPNFGKAGTGVVLLPGMTLAIEPMVTQFKADVYVDSDKWTVRTVDHGLAVHVEDTIVVTEAGVEVLTRLP
jgi:methionyl aminopeptidase